MPRNLDLHFSSSGEEASLRIVDNTIVCYAFLSVRGSIVGSVWLYNHSRKGPSRVGELVQNPAEYVMAAPFDEFLTEEDFHVNWMMRGGLWECGIYIGTDCTPWWARASIRGDVCWPRRKGPPLSRSDKKGLEANRLILGTIWRDVSVH